MIILAKKNFTKANLNSGKLKRILISVQSKEIYRAFEFHLEV